MSEISNYHAVEREGYLFAEINYEGFIVGYSSTILSNNCILFSLEELPSDFETHFSFYRLDSDLALVFDDTRVKEELNKPIPETSEQKVERLLKENAEIQIALAEVYEKMMEGSL